MTQLSHEIITYVDNNPHGLDFTEYYWDNYENGNGGSIGNCDGENDDCDGKFDMIVLVYRFSYLHDIIDNLDEGSAISSLGVLPGEEDFSGDTALHLGTYQVIDSFPSGSGVISKGIDKMEVIRTTAHEIGHRHFGQGHPSNDHFSIMNRESLLSFSALDRIRLDWANTLYLDINDISPDDYQSITLRDAHHPNPASPDTTYDALWIKQGNDESFGDVIVEARLGNAFVEQLPNGTHADGDLADYSLPNAGVYLYKPNPVLSRSNSYSLLNSSLDIRRVFFGNAETDHQGFGDGDAYTPFSILNYDLPTSHRTDIDQKLAITDFQDTNDTFVEFRVWGDYLKADTTKNLQSYYTFESNSVGNTNSWNLGGRFHLTGPVVSDYFTMYSDNSWDGLHIASNEVTLSNAAFQDIDAAERISIHVPDPPITASPPIPTIHNSLLETGVHVYGSNTQAELAHNVIEGSTSGSLYISGGANAYINRNDLIGSTSGFSFNGNANVHVSGATAQFSLPFPTFEQGYNRLYGGEYALKASGSSATIYAGTASSYKLNSFCDEEVKVRAINNGSILASNNYWSDPTPTQEISSGGSIIIGNILGKPNDCSGLLNKNQSNASPPSTVMSYNLNLNDRNIADHTNESVLKLYEAIELRMRNRFNDAFHLIEEIILEEEHPYFGIAVKELLVLAPHLEKDLVLSILNAYYENTEPEFATIILTNLALYHARNHDFDLSLSIHEQVEDFTMNASERFSSDLQHFYIAMDSGYRDIALTTLAEMEPTSELEDWERQKAVQVFERRELSNGQLIADRRTNSLKNPSATSVEVEASNYPNPFNPSTTIQYTLNESAMISLEVFDVLGRRVALLTDSVQEPGMHRAVFDAGSMATGMYLYRLSVNGEPTITNTMLLIK